MEGSLKKSTKGHFDKTVFSDRKKNFSEIFSEKNFCFRMENPVD